MLKYLTLGSKEVPVPIPIKDLAAALDWVDQTLIPESSIITRIRLNGRDVTHFGPKASQETLLNERSKLVVDIDSPSDLAFKTIDAARDLAEQVERKFRPVAVSCWQLHSDLQPASLKDCIADIELVLELVEHMQGILDGSQKELAPLIGLSRLMTYPLEALHQSVQKSLWSDCAHILLNRLEPLLKDFVRESESLQVHMIANRPGDAHRSVEF